MIVEKYRDLAPSCDVSYYKIYAKRGVINAYLQNLLLDCSPQ